MLAAKPVICFEWPLTDESLILELRSQKERLPSRDPLTRNASPLDLLPERKVRAVMGEE
jgi:hypothetical protein